VPPTGDGVLNQIPAGDGRESSREQVGSLVGAGPWYRSLLVSVCSAASLTHQKKKKKKKLIIINQGLLCIKMGDGVMVVGFEAEHRRL